MDSKPTPVLTVLIVAKEGSQYEKWRDVSKRIVHGIAGDLYDELSVKLIDEILYQRFNASPISNTDSISSVWAKVFGIILKELNFQDPRFIDDTGMDQAPRVRRIPPQLL